MIDLHRAADLVESDLNAVESWCDEIYQTNFAAYFADSRELFTRLQSTDQPITDMELSWILMELPMNLFDVAEILNKFRVRQETVKLKNKYELDQELDNANTDSCSLNASQILEQKILAIAYSTVITRVENEISFSRELIMGAKKIWDGRKHAENLMPVSEDSLTLPDYIPPEV